MIIKERRLPLKKMIKPGKAIRKYPSTIKQVNIMIVCRGLIKEIKKAFLII
jgi:hypothetical protein